MDKTQTGLYVSTILATPNPVQTGDLIIAIDDLTYPHILAAYLEHNHNQHQGAHTLTLVRAGKTIICQAQTRIMTMSRFLHTAWPHLMLIVLLLVLGSTALLQAPPDQPASLFFIMLCAFATVIASTLPSHFGLIDPHCISLSFLLLTLSNWCAFAMLVHFSFCFPRQRDIATAHPWLIVAIYLLSPLIAISSSLYTEGLSIFFLTALQRFRNICLPVLIVLPFCKHLYDLRQVRTDVVKSQLKIIITAYWITFGPYVLLYLLPNLFLDRPLISFRIILFSAIFLPCAYIVALLRYQLMEIDRLISRTSAYVTVIIVLTLAYSAILFFAQKHFWGQVMRREQNYFLFLLFSALILPPLANFTERFVDRHFFRHHSSDSELLFAFSQKLTSTLGFADLVSLIITDLSKQLDISKTALLILEENHSRLFPEQLRIGDRPWPQSQLVSQFQQDTQVLFCHEQKYSFQLNHELDQLKRAGFSVCLPLRGSSNLLGILLLGRRRDAYLFQDHEIRMLATLANQTAIAIENSLRYTSLVKSKQQLEDLYARVVQTEKLAVLGEMSATLAHEIKNPLGIIRSSAQYLVEENHPTDITQEMLHYIIDEVDALNLVITNIIGVARHNDPKFQPIDLEEFVRNITGKWQRSGDHNPGIIIEYNVADRLPLLYADLQQLNQVLFNLIRNSEQAMDEGGTLKISVHQKKGFALIRVRDDGPGIDDIYLDKLCNKFFTTRDNGLGLGLAVCKQIVTAHHGTIAIKNRPEGGAEVIIRLPFKPLVTMGLPYPADGKNVSR